MASHPVVRLRARQRHEVRQERRLLQIPALLGALQTLLDVDREEPSNERDVSSETPALTALERGADLCHRNDDRLAVDA